MSKSSNRSWWPGAVLAQKFWGWGAALPVSAPSSPSPFSQFSETEKYELHIGLHLYNKRRYDCLSVCLFRMAGQTAGPIETKLDTRTHVHPGSFWQGHCQGHSCMHAGLTEVRNTRKATPSERSAHYVRTPAAATPSERNYSNEARRLSERRSREQNSVRSTGN